MNISVGRLKALSGNDFVTAHKLRRNTVSGALKALPIVVSIHPDTISDDGMTVAKIWPLQDATEMHRAVWAWLAAGTRGA